MYEDHRVFKQPADKSLFIWRYMTIAKFISLLEYSSLHFTRTDKFEDQFEGVLTRPDIETMLKTDPTEIIRAKEVRERTAINCWYLNQHESAAMWQLYTSLGEGLAVRSTVQSLINACSDTKVTDRVIWIGTVDYIDYETGRIPPDNIYFPLMSKRTSFSHEVELRAVASGCEISAAGLPQGTWELLNESGYDHPIDLTTLIESIFVSPSAPGWYEPMVRKIVDRYRLYKPVQPSNLNVKPIW